jgi:hypothetical protein
MRRAGRMGLLFVVQPAFAARVAGGVPAIAGQHEPGGSVSGAVATLEMFDCTRLRARMTTRACGKQWLRANTATDRHGKPVEPPAWESLHHCLRCPIGAERNGKTVSSVADMVADLRSICPRCQRVSDRLVNVHGDRSRPLCISCYNRHAEVDEGRNAKGQQPTKLKLRTVRLHVIENGRARVARMENVTSASEAVLTLARRATGPMQFAPLPYIPEGAAWPRPEGVVAPDCEDEEEDGAIELSATLSARSAVIADLTTPPPAPPRPRASRFPHVHAWMLTTSALVMPPYEMPRIRAA